MPIDASNCRRQSQLHGPTCSHPPAYGDWRYENLREPSNDPRRKALFAFRINQRLNSGVVVRVRTICDIGLRQSWRGTERRESVKREFPEPILDQSARLRVVFATAPSGVGSHHSSLLAAVQ